MRLLNVYVNMFQTVTQDLQQDNDDPLKKLSQSTQKIVQCRICKGDHWTTKCPYKDQLEVIQAQAKEEEPKPTGNIFTTPSTQLNHPRHLNGLGQRLFNVLRQNTYLLQYPPYPGV